MPTTFDEALHEAQTKWMDIDGVEAVGQGTDDGRDCILVYVASKTTAVHQQIPDRFKGVPVRIEESGVIQTE